jgi:colanic acid biosynthesis glycosyl transferase WcaI
VKVPEFSRKASRRLMSGPKVIIVSQHYPPDLSTTAGIMAEIAEYLAVGRQVVVLSGMPGSMQHASGQTGGPAVIEIPNHLPSKGALVRRALVETLFTLRAFLMVLKTVRCGDVVLTVTAPFMLPYAVALAARLKRAKSALIVHDLYPDVLVMAGLLKPASIVAHSMRFANALMFRLLNAVITIGRDTERLLLRYHSLPADKIFFIPNWATLDPGIRPIDRDNSYRQALSAPFVVGLSGNLGFTHDPLIVFEAARLLRDTSGIHFLLSGWGIGFDRLRQLQLEANLPNVTLVDRVDGGKLERLLSAADVWLIPYRSHAAGVSVPSRFYNLLAVGRPIIMVSEPDAEAASIVTENDLGWVIGPGMACELANVIKVASMGIDPVMAERAVSVAESFGRDRAMNGYARVVDQLLQDVERT